jgi:hypothetical protein
MEADFFGTGLRISVPEVGVGIYEGISDDVDKVCFLNLYINQPALTPTRTVRRKTAG